MREDVISWHGVFTEIAQTISKRSKDPSTQVGACVVSPTNRVLSLGYNGAPNGIDDGNMPWEHRDTVNDEGLNKYDMVVHAELNAILSNRSVDMTDATMYVTHYPCGDCMKSIIQAGIRTVYYFHEPGYHYEHAAQVMARLCGIKLERLIPE